MLDCNLAATPLEANLKLVKNDEEKPVDITLYKQIVGCLRYMCNSRPDIAFGVGLVSRFMDSPKVSHLVAAKRILRYLKGTIDYGLLFLSGSDSNECRLQGFSDSDWCGDQTDRRSTTGYVFMMGKTSISWCSTKQPVVALSTCEAEYIAACFGACQAVWLDALLKEMHLSHGESVQMMVDNKSAIDLAKNPVSHGRSKHIETRFHYLRDQVNNGKLSLFYCRSEEQLADILTKPLPAERFKTLRGKLGVLALTDLN